MPRLLGSNDERQLRRVNDSRPRISRDSENKVYFDRWSESYDQGRISPWFQYTQRLTIDLLRLEPNARVLDVGCGTGYAVRFLGQQESVKQACGIDISAGMIEAACGQVPPELADSVEFVQASSDAIPYPDNHFDHVICTNSFHHYPDPVGALKEMQRALKPGGQIVIFENATDLSWYTWGWDRLLRIIEKGHVKYYTSKQLEDILQRAGLESVELCHLKNEFLKHGKLFASIQVWSAFVPKKSTDEESIHANS
jgi:ubiquinone/menaquinone biosynthesis C-methylase UbiE